MNANHVALGVKYGGTCALCGRSTGTRPWEMAETSLYKRDDGKFIVVHPRCAGGQTKHAVGGRTVYRTEPDHSITLPLDTRNDPEVQELKRMSGLA